MAKANITLRILNHLLSAHQIYDCSDHQCLRHRVHFLDKASRDLFIYAKYLFVEATQAPQTLGPIAANRRRHVMKRIGVVIGLVALLLPPLLLLFSVAANAENCVTVSYDNSPAAIVSGRITTHHKLPKGDLRTGDGPWLILDEPLLLGWYECGKWRKIAILPNLDGEGEKEKEAQIAQVRKWANQHVHRGQIGSVRVRPGFPIYLHRNYNHKEGLKDGVTLGRCSVLVGHHHCSRMVGALVFCPFDTSVGC